MNSRKFLSLLLPLIAALTLTACVQDTASYILPEKDHAITLMRNQTWLWQDKVNIDIIPMRLPDCHGGMQIKDVPRSNKLSFFAAPDDYPVPIFILQTGKRFYAISTLTCEVQKFDEAPANPGQLLGQFYEKDGKFQFVTSETMSDKPEKK
jgi:hypothetical protein